MTTYRVLLASVAWSDQPRNPWPLVDAQAIADYARDWYAKASYGKVDLQFTVAPWVRSDWPSQNPMADAKLVAIGFKPPQYDRIVYLTTRDQSVGYKGSCWGREMWVNCMDTTYARHALIHEFGHSIGLNHPQLIRLGTKAGAVLTIPPLTVTSDPSVVLDPGYSDASTAMGYEDTQPSFSAPEKALLGWITPEVYAGGDHTYTLTAIENQGGALYGVRVPMTTFRASSRRVYWVEHRKGTLGQDGVQVRITGGDFGCYGFAHVNATLQPYVGIKSFQPGERFTDGTIAIDVVSTTPDEAVIRITTVDIAPPIAQPPPTSGNTQMLTDIKTIVDTALAASGKITSAQKASGAAMWAALVTDDGTTPPITGDWTVLPGGNPGIDPDGGVWSFGTSTGIGGSQILRNGQPAGNGFGSSLALTAGKVYAVNAQGKRYLWTGKGWSQQ